MISQVDTATKQHQTNIGKEPIACLLDLTHGWASFVAHQEDDFADTLPSDDLYALYQDASRIAASNDPNHQSDAVRAFVEARIISLLLKGKL